MVSDYRRVAKPHKKLLIWARALDLVAEVYRVTKTFPADERFGLASQMRRAAVSIPSNIAEGAARRSRKEYIHYLYQARGSVSEIDAQLEIARRLDYLSDAAFRQLQDKSDELGRMMNALIVALAK
jgi:four helix bundle protein